MKNFHSWQNSPLSLSKLETQMLKTQEQAKEEEDQRGGSKVEVSFQVLSFSSFNLHILQTQKGQSLTKICQQIKRKRLYIHSTKIKKINNNNSQKEKRKKTENPNGIFSPVS